jgi:hypothetical protein
VRVLWLEPGPKIAAFRRMGEPLSKLFYARAGTGSDRLGIVPDGRQFQRFAVRRPTEALSSRAAQYPVR